MDTARLHVVADRDLNPLVSGWSSLLKSGGGQSHGLLELADKESSYFYGGAFLMSNAGPRANEPTATDEEVLLFAVLCLFQISDFPGTDAWEGIDAHLFRAFEYFQEVGGKEAARRLREDVIQRSLQEEPPVWKEMKRMRPTDPAEEALHDQDMASIVERSIRAAALLDPEGDFDSELRGLS